MSALNYFIAAAAFALLGLLWMFVNIKAISGFARFVSFLSMWASFLASSAAVVMGVWRLLA